MAGKSDLDLYLHRFKAKPKLVRIVLARPRLLIPLAIGVASFLVLPISHGLTTRLLIAWRSA